MKYWRFDLSIVFAAYNWSLAFSDLDVWLPWTLFALLWTFTAWVLRPWAAPTTGETDD